MTAREDAGAVVLRERQTRDRGWYDEMAACFTPDATIAMSWFDGAAADFIARTRARSQGAPWGRHRLSPPSTRVHGDRAWVELPLAIEFRIDLDGVEADLVSTCRSQYRLTQHDGTWRIAAVTSVYERDTLTPALPGQVLPVRADELTRFRPAYRCLAWWFRTQGTPLPEDLYGDDRPEPLASLYDDLRGWLRGEQP